MVSLLTSKSAPYFHHPGQFVTRAMSGILVEGPTIDIVLCATDDMTDEEIAAMKDVNWVNKNGFTRLHMAVQGNMPNVVERLLLKNADWRLKSNNNETAVRIAVELGFVEIVKLFCNAGVDMDDQTHKSSNALENLPLFLCAVHNAHLDVVKVLIAHGMDPSARLSDGTSGVHMSSIYDFDLEMLELLIHNGVDVNMRTIAKVTALGLASRNDNLKGMQLLLNKGADVGAKNIDGDTPLHLAMYGGYKENIQLLLEHGADMYIRNENGISPLDSASCTNVVCMYTLIQYGVDFERRDGGRKTPFLNAVKHRNYKVVQLLMTVGADTSVRDMDHNTAMHFAAKDGDVEFLRDLIRSGNNITEKNFYGDTPLQLAIAAEGPVLGRFEKRGWWVDHEACQVVLREALAREMASEDIKDVILVD